MGDGSGTARNRRISFSAAGPAVVVTRADSASSEMPPELAAAATEAYGSAPGGGDGKVPMGELEGLLSGLAISAGVSDFLQRQKVVPKSQETISQQEFVSLAGAFDEYAKSGEASSSSGPPGASEIAPALLEKLTTFFKKVDVDGDNSITQDEAIKFWGKNFAKVNATAMFNEVDSDGDGSITFDEWIGFWVNVLAHGYDQDDLEEEVEMLLEGNSWVDFNDGRTT